MLWHRFSIPVLGLLFSSAAMAQMQALREAARLDSEGRCSESEPYYPQALASGSASPALLNNTANHYVICGQPDKARAFFEQLLRINPAHENANLQLARLAADEQRGEKALTYL